MSCLLYNFAIEPLGEMIRKTRLKGIKIENNGQILVHMFTDNTLVYLDKQDKMERLNKVLKTFCRASTAKVNIEKTEYLPVGENDFRKKVIEERIWGKNQIEIGPRIIKDSKSMRTLGSWVGNEKNDRIQWEKIMENQQKVINMWSKMNLSYRGKELVLKALIQFKATYLMTVNGLPKDIKDKMKRMYKEFIWDNKKALMSWEQIIAPRDKGRLRVPDIKSRLEVIEIMWIKKWLALTEKRPKWATILNKIIMEKIPKSPMIDRKSRISWILQSWHEFESKEIKLSHEIRYMLKIARKYNITAIARKYSKETKRQLPLWHNTMMTNANYQ